MILTLRAICGTNVAPCTAVALEGSCAQYEESSDGLLILDASATRLLHVSARAREMLGYTEAELCAGRIPVLVPCEDLLVQPLRLEELRAGQPTLTERRLRRKDGSLVPVEVRARMLSDGRIQALLRDLSPRRARESRDAARLAVARLLSEASDLGKISAGLLQALCEGMGWDRGELWMASAGDVLRRCRSWGEASLDPATLVDASSDRTLRRGEGFLGRIWAEGKPDWLATPDGRAMAFPLLGASGIHGVLVFGDRRREPPDETTLQQMADVGRLTGQFIERRRAERESARLQGALERAAFEWRLTFDAIDSRILIVDTAGRLVRLNRAAREGLGHAFEEVLGQPLAAFAASEPWKTAATLASAAMASRTPGTSHARDEASGRTFDVAATLAAGVETPEAGVETPDDRVIVVARDVTRLVELQESLRRSETMSAMGALVAGVAHEVRNPLFSISANLDAFEVECADLTQFRPTLEVLRREVDRLSALMRELLDYGRPLSLDLSEHGPEDAMAEAVRLCQGAAARHKVKLAFTRQRRRLPALLMDRPRLVQVFQNLLENAIQHSPPGSVIRLSTRRVAQGSRVAVECLVEDSGPGFREEDLPLLFEPFFTRRPGGIGLGLSIVARIVDAHGGQVLARNRREGGAVMVVRLWAES